MSERPSTSSLKGLQRENNNLRLLVDIYDRLSALVLQGASASAITTALSELVQRPVLLLDAMLRPVSREPARTGWSPTEAYVGRVLQTIAAERRSLRLPPLPAWGVDTGCVLAPILAGEDTLGYVAILEATPDSEADGSAEAGLLAAQHAAGVYALALMRERLTAEVTRELRDEMLDGLLLGQLTEDQASQRAQRLGYDDSLEYRLLVIRPEGTADDGRQILESATHLLQERAPRAISSRRRHELIALVPEEAGPALAALSREVSQAVATIYSGAQLTTGVSGICHTPAEISRCYEQARRSAEVASRFGRRGEVLAFEDLGLYRLLFHVSDREELRSFVDQTLGALLEYDQRHHTDFAQTIGAYLRNNNNLQATARELSIHVNTATYRIQRIQAITGLDLTRTEDSLLARVALMILEDAEVSG